MLTWAEKSEDFKNEMISFIKGIVDESVYEVKDMMSGFNDRIVIKPRKENNDNIKFISVIIGWFYADLELAVVHRFNNNTEYKYITDEYLKFDNLNFEIEKDRHYLKDNTIKYYPQPFTDKYHDLKEDIIKILSKL